MALNKTEEYLRETKSWLSIDSFTYANAEVMEYFNRSLEATNFAGVTVSTRDKSSQLLWWGGVCLYSGRTGKAYNLVSWQQLIIQQNVVQL